MAHPPPLPPRLQLLSQDLDDTEPGIGVPPRPKARNDILPPGLPRVTDPVTMPSPFPPGSLAPPKRRAKAKWLGLGAAVLGLGLEVARIWYPALISPLELLGDGLQLLQ